MMNRPRGEIGCRSPIVRKISRPSKTAQPSKDEMYEGGIDHQGTSRPRGRDAKDESSENVGSVVEKMRCPNI
jgi:hypothetical protein